MHHAFRATAIAAFLLLPAPFAAAELQVTIANGRATVIATDVPLRQILAEWSRVGQTKIVNGEKLAGPNLTLQIVDRPEREVLDILLRSAAGYMIAPREMALANASQFDRIMILPTSRAPAVSAAAPPPTFGNRQPIGQPMPVPDQDDEPVEQTLPPGMQQPQPGNVPQQFPIPGMPQPGQPGTTQQPPLTAPRPGVVVGSPQQPGVPNPYQPPPVPVVRPPGSGRGGGGN